MYNTRSRQKKGTLTFPTHKLINDPVGPKSCSILLLKEFHLNGLVHTPRSFEAVGVPDRHEDSVGLVKPRVKSLVDTGEVPSYHLPREVPFPFSGVTRYDPSLYDRTTVPFHPSVV